MIDSGVSVIMPAYNCENYIANAIESVLEQTYSNWELIIVDDNSTDTTVNIVEQYVAKYDNIKLIKMSENKGASYCRNKAIKESQERFIAFLDSDDVWLNTKLKKQIKYMISQKIAISCTSYKKIDKYGNDMGIEVKARNVYDFQTLLKHSPGNSTMILDSQIIGKIEIPYIKKRNDYLYWLTILDKKRVKIYGIDEQLSSHRVLKNSLSSKKSDLLKYHWYIYDNVFQLGKFKSIYLCLFWGFKGIINKFNKSERI